MINTYRILPVYTGDVSGVASALYELGGMVVMHDPSGCNSTYNTHDEVRWYDRESAIYISGLSETDAILGNDKKFIDDILFAATEIRPKFIALCSAPIPYLNGTDFVGIAKLVEQKSGIPAFFVESNGMHDYSVGVSKAMLALAKKFVKESGDKTPVNVSESKEKNKTKANLLGLTPLDINGNATRVINTYSDYDIVSSFCMNSSIEEIEKAWAADVNIVVSVTGFEAAKWMEQEFGIPYIVGRNITDADKEIIRKSNVVINENDKVYLVGEPVYMRTLATYIGDSFKAECKMINPLECILDKTEAWMEEMHTQGEEDVEEILKSADIVLGDPLYRYVSEGKRFIDMPHLAFSGRIFLKNIKEFLD